MIVRSFAAINFALLLVLASSTLVYAQPSSSTPMDYDAELSDGEPVNGTVNASSDRWDFYRINYQAGVPVNVTVTSTSGIDHDIFLYQGAGQFPSGSTFSAVGSLLDSETGCCVSVRTLDFNPNADGQATIVIEVDSCCSDANYTVVATGVSGIGPIDLVPGGGFFEQGDTIQVPIAIADSSLSKTGSPSLIAGTDFVLEYDGSLVSLVSVELADATSDWLLESNIEANQTTIALASLTTINPIGTNIPILDLTFAAIGLRGDMPLTIRDSNVFDITREPVDHGTVKGLLVVGCDPGDVQKDGEINTADAIFTLQIGADLVVPTNEQFCAADVDGNDMVDTGDAVLVLRSVVGLSKEINPPPMASSVTLEPGTQAGELLVHFQDAAGLEVLLSYDDANLTFDHATGPGGALFLPNVKEEGVLKLVMARATRASGTMTVQFGMNSDEGTVVLNSARSFDTAGVAHLPSFGETAVQLSSMATSVPAPLQRAAYLQNAWPNPFNPQVELSFVMSRAGEATIRILDVAGREVRRFDRQVGAAGEYSVTWDGRSKDGSVVASGSYVVQLEALGLVDVTRITLLK